MDRQQAIPPAEHHLPWDGGVSATQLTATLQPMFGRIDHYPLSAEMKLWGKTVSDERYAIVAQDATAK